MKSILTFTFLIICLAISARQKTEGPSKEELTMAYCEFDPKADAAILNNSGHYYFNRHYYFSAQELRTIYHYTVRLKIFTEEGKKYATIRIPYNGYDEYENVIEISGATYNLENGKIVKSKLKVKTAQWNRNGRNTWYCTFTLPDVKAGSVIEYTYKIASLDFVKLRDWMFQKDIPVVTSNLIFSTPNFFQYAFFSNIPNGLLNVSKKDQQFYIQFYNLNLYTNGTDLQLTTHNIPAFRNEVYMPDSSTQIYKGEFLLSMAITRPPEFAHINDYYLMPYLKPLLITTTYDYYEPKERIGLYNEIIGGYKIIEGMEWESFVKKLSKKDEFGKGMLKAFENKFLIDSFRRIEAGKNRMVAVYNYVKENIRWNGKYRIFASNSMEKIFEQKSGYSADVNMLLINLLNRSGIQARPVLISTRSYGTVYKELGFYRKFNHVIVLVFLDGERYLLDATDPDRPYDMLSIDDLNGEGLLVNLMDYQWIDLSNTQQSALQQKENVKIKNDVCEVESESVYTGYSALQKLNELRNSEENGISTFGGLQPDKPLIIKKSFSGKLEKNGELISFAPITIKTIADTIFADERRTHPVDFKFEQSFISEVNIDIPEGMSLVSYPQQRSFDMQGQFLSCSLIPEVKGQSLKLIFRVDVNNPYIPFQLYKEMLLFFQTVQSIEKEKVVLKVE